MLALILFKLQYPTRSRIEVRGPRKSGNPKVLWIETPCGRLKRMEKKRKPWECFQRNGNYNSFVDRNGNIRRCFLQYVATCPVICLELCVCPDTFYLSFSVQKKYAKKCICSEHVKRAKKGNVNGTVFANSECSSTTGGDMFCEQRESSHLQ